MKYSWSQRVLPIAILFSFRMLGLFMLIPVFTLLASSLQNATPRLIGLALGAYGLTQGLLQIPLGLLSDRWGRKPILTFGLIIFVIGSFIGALSDSITMIILARILQGMGAIGGVLIALLTDLTSEKERTKAMAVIGLTIGLSFGLAMAVSPIIANIYGLNGIFYFSTLMGICGLFLLYLMVPIPEAISEYSPHVMKGLDKEQVLNPHGSSNQTATTSDFNKSDWNKISTTNRLKNIFINKQLQCLNAGILFQHMILTATFFALPLLLRDYISKGNLTESWHFYLILMLISFILMFPCIAIAEKKQQMKKVFHFAVILTMCSQFLLIFLSKNWFGFCVVMLFYFLAFNILEASLPSLVSKQADSNNKGTAMGVYSSSQFLGIFIGGTLAGLFYSWGGIVAIFIVNAFFSILWVGINSYIQLNFSTRTNTLDVQATALKH